MPNDAIEGRIPGFDNRWNKTQCDVIGKEDKLRWKSLDLQMKIREDSGMPRRRVKLQRAHSAIGPFPGCFRRVELSPRKSATQNFLEQKLCGSSHEDPDNPSLRDLLCTGVSHEEQGRHEYLKKRAAIPLNERYKNGGLTSSQSYGYLRPEGEYRASRNCHKPVLDKEFRVSGVMTYLNLPDIQKR